MEGKNNMKIQKLFLLTLLGVGLIGCKAYASDVSDQGTLFSRFLKMEDHPELLGEFFKETKTKPTDPVTSCMSMLEWALMRAKNKNNEPFLKEMLKYVDDSSDVLAVLDKHRKECKGLCDLHEFDKDQIEKSKEDEIKKKYGYGGLFELRDRASDSKEKCEERQRVLGIFEDHINKIRESRIKNSNLDF